MSNKQDIIIEQGSKYSQKYQYWDEIASEPVNLTGFTAKAQVRSKHESTTVLIEFDITFNALNGEVTLSAKAGDTAALSAPQDAVWDLYLIPPTGTNDQFRWLEGNVTITAGVTR